MEKQYLSSFVAGRGILVSCLFMCFSIDFQTNSCGFFICLFFPIKLHFRVFLRIKTIQVSSGAILSFAKKTLRFERTRTLTIYGDQGIMAHVP